MKTMKQKRWIVGHQEKICLLSLPKKDNTVSDDGQLIKIYSTPNGG